jgi:Rod binding domain-containing protein
MVAAVSAPAQAAEARTPQLLRAAQEFEAMLLKELLKSASDEPGKTDGAEQAYDDFRLEATASSMAQQGGIGIARMLLQTLQKVPEEPEIKGSSSFADY